MPSPSAAGRPRTAFRTALLSGAAYVGAAVLSFPGIGRAANILPTQAAINLAAPEPGTLAAKVLVAGAVTPTVFHYTSTGSSAILTLPPKARTLIDWTTFEVGAGDALSFIFTNSTSDVVLNRVPAGVPITIDAGGTVTGTFGGTIHGNIWFLADGGVFIHGKVMADGVLATNNPTTGALLSNLDLLSDAVGVLKSNLAAAKGLIDLSGVVIASGAELDATTGDIVLTGPIDAGTSGTVDLRTVGTIAAHTATITAATLSGSSAGGTTLDNPSNAIATFGPFRDTANGAVTLLDSRPLILTGAVNIGTGTLSLTSTGTIAGNGATITAGALTGSAAGGASFGNSGNAIGAFGPFGDTANGDVTLSNGQLLTVTGAVNIGAGTLTLISTGAIRGNGAAITAARLSGSSAGGAAFGDSGNTIGTFGPFGDAGNGEVTLADSRNLTVTGVVNIGTGTLSLTSSGSIMADAATITAATLSGSSVGGASFNNSANAIGALQSFNNAASGDVVLADGVDLSANTITNTLGSVNLSSTGALGVTGAALSPGVDLILSAGASLNLAASPVVVRDYVISARSFLGRSLAPTFSRGRDFIIGGQGSLTLAAPLTATRNLTVTSTGVLDTTGAILTARGGTLTLQGVTGLAVGATTAALGPTSFSTATGGNIVLDGAVNAGAQSLTLNSAGTIGETLTGTITASTVTGSSVGGATLAQSNLFDTLGSFTNSGVGNVSITGARTAGLTVGGPVDAGAGNTLTLTTTMGVPLTLAGNLTAGGGTVALISGGPIRQVAGFITTSTLTGSSAGGGMLTQNNLFADLGGFINSGARNLSITDAWAGGLTVTSAVDAGAGNTLTLTTTSGAAMTLAANVTAGPGGAVSLVSAGPLTQPSGVITAASLTGSAVGGATLTGANQLASLARFSNAGAGDITITDAAASGLTVIGTVEVGAAHAVTLTTTGGPLVLSANLNAPSGGSVSLVSYGAIDQTAGIVATGILTGASAGGASLTGANAFGTLSGFVNRDSGAITLVDAGSLAVTGSVDNTRGIVGGAGRDISLTSSSGSLTGAGVFAAARDIRLQAPMGSIAYANLTAYGDILLAAGAGVTGGAGAAGGDVAISGANVTIGAQTAGDDIVLRTPGALRVNGGLSSGLGVDRTGAGDSLAALAPLTLFRTADPALTGGVVDILAGTVTVSGSTTASGSASDVRIVTTGADSETPALNLAGAVGAGQDVVLEATSGSIAVGGATAGRDIAAGSTAGSITLVSASAGDDVVLVAPGGAVTLDGSIAARGGAARGIGQTLFGAVSGALNGLFTLGAQSIFIDAASYANQGYGAASPATLTAANAIGMALSDPSGLTLADASPIGGSWVMASTLLAPTVSLFESRGNVDVGPATVNRPVTKLNLYTGDLVRVTGLVAPATDDTVNLSVGDPVQAVWTPSQIDVINDGGASGNAGAIGFTSVNAAGVYSTSPRTFDTVALYATADILLGTQTFVTANAAVTSIAQIKQIDPSRPVPATGANLSKAVMLAAGDLTLTAGRLIVQQNTGGLRTTNGAGYYVTRTLRLGAYTPYPPAIDVFGVFVKPGTTTPITGPAAALVDRIVFVGNLATSPDRSLYRINSCVIKELSNCTPTGDAIVNIPLDQLSQFALLGRDELDVEDPTITGATNEEIWRRSGESP